MPRSIDDILAHAEELADWFEQWEPRPEDERDPAPFRALMSAVLRRSESEREVADAVKLARERGYSWSQIGSILGTSGEAARQRYGPVA